MRDPVARPCILELQEIVENVEKQYNCPTDGTKAGGLARWSATKLFDVQKKIEACLEKLNKVFQNELSLMPGVLHREIALLKAPAVRAIVAGAWIDVGFLELLPAALELRNEVYKFVAIPASDVQMLPKIPEAIAAYFPYVHRHANNILGKERASRSREESERKKRKRSKRKEAKLQ